jgi:hypothetical protein
MHQIPQIINLDHSHVLSKLISFMNMMMTLRAVRVILELRYKSKLRHPEIQMNVRPSVQSKKCVTFQGEYLALKLYY